MAVAISNDAMTSVVLTLMLTNTKFSVYSTHKIEAGFSSQKKNLMLYH